jgi:hypothetical protein
MKHSLICPASRSIMDIAFLFTCKLGLSFPCPKPWLIEWRLTCRLGLEGAASHEVGIPMSSYFW